MLQDYVVCFTATFYGGNDTQRTKMDSNMLLHTSLLSHKQSCNIWTELNCQVTPLLLILEEMWSGKCKHHMYNERQHWWIVDEIVCSQNLIPNKVTENSFSLHLNVESMWNTTGIKDSFARNNIDSIALEEMLIIKGKSSLPSPTVKLHKW